MTIDMTLTEISTELTREELLISDMIMSMMGVDKLAYIKPVCEDDSTHFAVFAADGTQLATFDCRDEAFRSVRRHNLTPVDIH